MSSVETSSRSCRCSLLRSAGTFQASPLVSGRGWGLTATYRDGLFGLVSALVSALPGTQYALNTHAIHRRRGPTVSPCPNLCTSLPEPTPRTTGSGVPHAPQRVLALRAWRHSTTMTPDSDAPVLRVSLDPRVLDAVLPQILRKIL